MKKVVPIIVLLLACQKNPSQTVLPKTDRYSDVPQPATIAGAVIREASGITYSRKNTGSLWVNQDSGNPPMLYLLHRYGSVVDSLMIQGATNRDWEDMTIGAGPVQNESYLYVADIGDNDLKYGEYAVLRFPEPAAGVQSLASYDQLRFVYDDGSHDAEAILVDDQTRDIYVITKRDTKSRVYRVSYPQSTSEVNTAVFVTELPYSGVVSAAAAASGEELIVKTYAQVYHYRKERGTSIGQALTSGAYKQLGYQLEPQGEAVSFSSSTDGFYTLSEEAMGIVPKLYFYARIQE